MIKILFIPVNSIQAEIFARVIRSFNKKVLTQCISLDNIYRKRYPHYLAEPIFKKFNLSFKRIEEYNSANSKAVLDEEKPDVIVNCQDAMDPLIRQITNIAEKQNIPVLVIQDAFMFYEDSPYNSPEQYAAKTILEKLIAIGRDTKHIASIFDYGYNWKMRGQRILIRLKEILKGTPVRWGDGKYTKIAVSGEYTKNMLQLRQIDDAKIVVTGQPRWDHLSTMDVHTIRNEILKKLGINARQKIVLLTTQPLVESRMWDEKDREYYITTIVKIISDQNDLKLLIKLHPRENIESYERILVKNNLKEKCLIYHNENTYNLIACCDVLLTHLCTTAIEAIILDKPVIVVDLKHPTEKIPYVAKGAALGVNQPKDLLVNIRRVLEDNQTREFLADARKAFAYECAHLQDGNASKRVADLIIQMIKEPKNKKCEES